MRRSILFALLLALYAAPLVAAEPALERIYDAGPLQRELPGFPKPRPGGAGADGAGAGGDTELTLTLGSGQGGGQGAGQGGQGGQGASGTSDSSGEQGGQGAQGSGQGGGGKLRLKLNGGGGGGGQGDAGRGEGGRGDARRGGAGQGAGGQGGGVELELSGEGGGGGGGGERGGHGGAGGEQGGQGAQGAQGGQGGQGAGEQGAGGDAGASAAPATPQAPAAPKPPPAPPYKPEPLKLPDLAHTDPTMLIFKLLGAALLAVMIIGFGVWLARRMRESERQTEVTQAPGAPSALLDELAARAGGGSASTLAEQGRWSEAIHALLLEALRGVLARDASLGQPSLTARAICARVVLGEAARGALATLVQAAELCVFAGELADQQLYLRCAAAADALRVELERGGAR